MTKRIALMVVVTLMAGHAQAAFTCGGAALSTADLAGTYAAALQTPQGVIWHMNVSISTYGGLLTANFSVPQEVTDPYTIAHWDGRAFGEENGTSFELVALAEIGPGCWLEGTASANRGGGMMLSVPVVKWGWHHDARATTFSASSSTGGRTVVGGYPIPCASHSPPPMNELTGRSWEWQYDTTPVYNGSLVFQGANFEYFTASGAIATAGDDVYLYWVDAWGGTYLRGWIWPGDRNAGVLGTILGWYPNGGPYAMANGGLYGPNGLGGWSGNIYDPSTWASHTWDWWLAGGVYP